MQPETAHILLVEDNASYRQEAIAWLTEELGYGNVTAAASPAMLRLTAKMPVREFGG